MFVDACVSLVPICSVSVLAFVQCFRFGVAVASVANALLRELKGEKRPLLGSLAGSCLDAKVTASDPADEP